MLLQSLIRRPVFLQYPPTQIRTFEVKYRILTGTTYGLSARRILTIIHVLRTHVFHSSLPHNVQQTYIYLSPIYVIFSVPLISVFE